jgi:alpha-mannosidase
MGWEESTPLEQDQIRSQDKALDLPRPLNGNEASFLTIDDPDLLLDTWKPAEDGKGTILRFIDLGGEPRTVTVHTPLLSISNIVETDAVDGIKSRLSRRMFTPSKSRFGHTKSSRFV